MINELLTCYRFNSGFILGTKTIALHLPKADIRWTSNCLNDNEECNCPIKCGSKCSQVISSVSFIGAILLSRRVGGGCKVVVTLPYIIDEEFVKSVSVALGGT